MGGLAAKPSPSIHFTILRMTNALGTGMPELITYPFNLLYTITTLNYREQPNQPPTVSDQLTLCALF